MFAAAFARDIFPFPLQIASDDDDEKLNTRADKKKLEERLHHSKGTEFGRERMRV